MFIFTNVIIYIFLFVSLFFEIFLLITYFERRQDMREENIFIAEHIQQHTRTHIDEHVTTLPTVTIMVPCWNEEKTLAKTITSLLELEYPHDLLRILIIDDGSTDGTLAQARAFENNPQIQVFHKENGGKHSALNFGLTHITSQFVGCLDADSYVDSKALLNIIPYFEDPEIMAVTPSVKVWKPKGIIQLIQKVEYGWGILIRKMFSYLDAMYVTPGPFSIFRREVFIQLGGYRYAHQTEDMEMALRMQKNHYKMANSHSAHVYTVTPDTLRKLYRQRLRWSYGFIKNVVDYREMLFRKEYGNLGIFVLPMASISVGSGLYVLSLSIFHFLTSLINAYVKIKTVGFHFSHLGFDWFYINTQFIAIASIITFMGTLTLVFLSRRMAEGKFRLGMDLVYYLALYAFIAPLWLGSAIWNAVFSVKTSWR